MKVFTSNDFKGYYPVGTAAVVIASTRERAIELLDEKLLTKIGKVSVDEGYTLREIPMREDAIILYDGNY